MTDNNTSPVPVRIPAVPIKSSPVPALPVVNPIAVNQPTLNFNEAIAQAVGGKKITRLDWKDNTTYVFIEGEVLKIHLKDGITHNLIVRTGDISGTDWITL